MIIPSLIAAALTFAAPEQMAQAGHVYKQAYQQKANNGRAHEYTDNNESVQNWTRLVTLNTRRTIARRRDMGERDQESTRRQPGQACSSA
jgi:hypothetical protein